MKELQTEKKLSPILRAFSGTVKNLNDDSPGITAATTASKARYRFFLSANDAGYDVKFQEIIIRRAPEFDSIVEELGRRNVVLGRTWAAEELRRKTEKAA